MISSRLLADLHPRVRYLALCHITACQQAGIDVIVTSTWRDSESQDALYAQGRTKPGKRVTNARAGQSWHNWRLAYDVVPLRYGKPVWGDRGADLDLWKRVGEIGKECGLEWGGDWEMRDLPHFQYTGGMTLADMQAGKTLPNVGAAA